MIGLMFLFAGVFYLAALIWATWAAYRWGKKRGLSRPKRWLAASGGFVIVYLPVFWDYIPTVIAHKYYCEKDAGFWVYKTLDQWKKENPGVAETLVANRDAPATRHGDMDNYTDTYLLNQRLKWVVSKSGPLAFNRWRWEKTLIDTKTNEVLARYLDFSTGSGYLGGPPRALRFWLQSDHCIGGQGNMYSMDALVGNMSHGTEGVYHRNCCA